ncbi:MAG: hypothetical protein JO007_10070 [Alphaproteobacteria bacterium]|nr:hypothetical protein [Alphaproteobacteria bacterium]
MTGWARDDKPILVLDGIGNPHNLGAIARTAAFFGIERLVLADCPEQACHPMPAIGSPKGVRIPDAASGPIAPMPD